MSDDSQQYKAHVTDRIDKLLPVFAKASIGDFSQDIEIPETDDEFSPLYAGVQIMLDVIRKQLDALNELNQSLASQLSEIETAKKQVEREKIIDEAILNGIGDGVVVLNSKGEIVLANYQTEVLLGFSQQEMLQHPYGEVVLAYDRKNNLIPTEKRPFMQALRSKQNYSYDCFYQKKDLSKLPVSVTAAPVQTPGEESGVVLVFKDRSKEHQLQVMRDEFISMAAHQLRTPLGVMRWNIELLQKKQSTELSPEAQEKLQTIYNNNARMIDMVNDLLSTSRIEQGRMSYSVEKIDVVAAIRAAVAEQQVFIDNKKINFQLTCDPATQYIVEADPDKLHSILANLLNNAIKFNVENGSIVVELTQTPNSVILEMSDTGIGIPPDELPRVFEKFYRTSNAIQAQTQGTGLGLYLVKFYLEAWKGTIKLSSPAKKEFKDKHPDQTQPGTTVVVELSKKRTV